MDLRQKIEKALTSFDGDPADTAFQRGYRQALADMLEADCPQTPPPHPRSTGQRALIPWGNDLEFYP